jgi:hypothetical protein
MAELMAVSARLEAARSSPPQLPDKLTKKRPPSGKLH